MIVRSSIVLLAIVAGCERASSVSEVHPLPAPSSVQGGPATDIDPTHSNTIQQQPATQDAPTAIANSTPDQGGCGDQLGHQPPTDLYLALTRGTPEERGTAALEILKTRASHARAVLQRAIFTVGTHPYCPQLRPLTDALEDTTLDDPSRAAAALALGQIANKFPCTFPSGACPAPHNPIPNWSQRALHDCAVGLPVMVARACVEALGYVSSTDPAFLVGLRDNTAGDPLLRIFAGRALSRLTKTRQVTKDSLSTLMGAAHSMVGQ